MAKLIKRIGTRADKFSIELEFKKIEMNSAIVPPKSKCSLVYLRGRLHFLYK